MTRTSRFVLAIVLFGSLVGLFDLVGHDLLKCARVEMKSPYLTGLVFFVLITARVLFDKPGSTFLMGAVAGLFKLAGFVVLGRDVWVCQCGAVVIQAGALDVLVSLVSSGKGLRLRVIVPAALAACFVSYLGFVGLAAVISHGGQFSSPAYISEYLTTRLPIALLVAAAAAFLGLLVGRSLRRGFVELESRAAAYLASAVGLAVVAIAVFILDLRR
jgi:hypothetical protein